MYESSIWSSRKHTDEERKYEERPERRETGGERTDRPSGEYSKRGGEDNKHEMSSVMGGEEGTPLLYTLNWNIIFQSFSLFGSFVSFFFSPIPKIYR